MSGFSGVIAFKNIPLLRFDKSLIKNSLTQRGYGFKEIGQNNFYLNNVRNRGQLSKQNLISIDNYVINFDGRIDNKEELVRKFKLGKKTSDSEIILRLFLKFGKEVISDLRGPYAFVIKNISNDYIFCARDHLGIKPFYFYNDSKYFAFGSEISHIFNYLNIDTSLCNNQIRDFVLSNQFDESKTFFKNIFKVPRGSFLEFKNQECKLYKYFEFNNDDGYLNFSNDYEYEEAFRNTFARSIKRMIPESDNRIGTALSGGLDSSSITRLLAKNNIRDKLNKEIFSISYKFSQLEERDIQTTDEMKYAYDVIKMGDINPIIVEIPRRNVISYLIDNQEKYPEPCLHGNRYLEKETIEACNRNNIETFFTGYDGDVTVSYGMELIQELFSNGEHFKAINLNRKVRKNLGLPLNSLRIYLSYVVSKNLPLNIHYFLRNIKNIGNYEPNSIFLNKDLKNKINRKYLLKEIRRMKYDFKNGHKNLLNSSSFSRNFEMLDIDFSYSGVEERHPFCDIDLMNLCLRIPPSQKLKNGKTRNILREALKDDLPRSVYRRMKKSNLSPYFFYSFDLMRNELFEKLIYSNSVIADMLDKQKLKKLSNSDKLTLEQKTIIVAYNCVESWIHSNNIMNK